MPGANCSIVGCSTSRRDKEIAIFRLPTDKNDQTRKWRADMLNIITRDRQVDQNLRKQIANNALHVCERHFNEEDLYYCKYNIVL